MMGYCDTFRVRGGIEISAVCFCFVIISDASYFFTALYFLEKPEKKIPSQDVSPQPQQYEPNKISFFLNVAL